MEPLCDAPAPPVTKRTSCMASVVACGGCIMQIRTNDYQHVNHKNAYPTVILGMQHKSAVSNIHSQPRHGNHCVFASSARPCPSPSLYGHLLSPTSVLDPRLPQPLSRFSHLSARAHWNDNAKFYDRSVLPVMPLVRLECLPSRSGFPTGNANSLVTDQFEMVNAELTNWKYTSRPQND